MSGKEVKLLSEFLMRGGMPSMEAILIVVVLFITYAIIDTIRRK